MNTEPEINLVKKTCKELGITQKELAERIGVSRQTIYDWSSGKTPVPNWGYNFMSLLIDIPALLILKETFDKLTLMKVYNKLDNKI